MLKHWSGQGVDLSHSGTICMPEGLTHDARLTEDEILSQKLIKSIHLS